jgi:hypothetical protein
MLGRIPPAVWAEWLLALYGRHHEVIARCKRRERSTELSGKTSARLGRRLNIKILAEPVGRSRPHTGHSLAITLDVYRPIAFFVSFAPIVAEGDDAEVRRRGAA